MAIYHLSVKPVSRGVGRSATAAAAYRSASQVADRTTGQVFDYTRKSGVEHAEIVLPTEAAKRDINWPREREQLWNVAEEAEKRKDARVAREYEVALPHELSAARADRAGARVQPGDRESLWRRGRLRDPQAAPRGRRAQSPRARAHDHASDRARRASAPRPKSNGPTPTAPSGASVPRRRRWRRSASAGRRSPTKSCRSTATSRASTTAASKTRASTGNRRPHGAGGHGPRASCRTFVRLRAYARGGHRTLEGCRRTWAVRARVERAGAIDRRHDRRPEGGH